MTSNIVVIDTNIISYIFYNRELSKRYESHLKNTNPVIAAQTIAELRFGAYLKNWGEKRLTILESLINTYTVIHTNNDICTAWASIKTQSYQKGRPMSEADIWIAATALAFGVPLVTHNKKDFDFIDKLSIISEQA